MAETASQQLVTHQQNQANRRVFRSSPSSRFRGVHKRGRRWKAQIRINQKTRHIGVFDSEEDAAAAYNAVAKKAFGEHFAQSGSLNHTIPTNTETER